MHEKTRFGGEPRKEFRPDPFRVMALLQIHRQAPKRPVSVILPEGASVQHDNALIAGVVVVDGGHPKGTLPQVRVEHQTVSHLLPVPERKTFRNHRRIFSDGRSHGRSPLAGCLEEQSCAVQLDLKVA